MISGFFRKLSFNVGPVHFLECKGATKKRGTVSVFYNYSISFNANDNKNVIYYIKCTLSADYTFVLYLVINYILSPTVRNGTLG